MADLMTFDPVTPAIGGALIGLGAALLMLLNGRIAGVSGIFAEILYFRTGDWGWRVAFVLGLIAAPILAGLAGVGMPAPQMPSNWAVVIIGGLMVGVGARLGSGCTSAHGVCGVARLSPRSIVATALFMAAAATVVAVVRHGLGG
jgi:uncharacterized protein